MKTVILKKRGLKHNRAPEPVSPPRQAEPVVLKKVIFLDLDGVLNFWTRADSLTEGVENMWTGRCLAPSCVQVFNQLVQETGASVVISSSWKDRPEYRWDLESLKRTLRDEGGVDVENIIGVTKNIGTRLTEIFTWLREHPEFNRFAILDDNVGGMHSVTEHLVLTQTSTGLVQEDIERAKACLETHHYLEKWR